jgi:glycine cleavage system regulatory protein
MNSTLVMTILSADRPGLVSQLSSVIAEHGGNWLESRMAHLGGHFAGILRIELPAEQEPKLLAALRALESQGITVHTHADSAAAPATPGQLVTVTVVGHDRPGIVRQISQVFAQLRVNVEDFASHVESAPMSGESHFHATATVQLPATCTLAQLRQSLESLATDLMVDINVRQSPAGVGRVPR